MIASKKTPRSVQARQKARKQAQNIREKAAKMSNLLTNSKAFKKLVDWAYQVCDAKKSNHINQAELYAGLLLVHVKLAKFCGAAACMPPSRSAVDDLFEASDVDNSGGIDREEFNIILSVSCAQIMGRILINYATMIFVIPFFAQKIVDRWGISEGSYMETVCEQFTGLILFLLIIPLIWGRLDREAHKSAGRKADDQRTAKRLNSKTPTLKSPATSTTSMHTSTNPPATLSSSTLNDDKKKDE